MSEIDHTGSGLTIKCPLCGAEAGRLCRNTADGSVNMSAHHTRRLTEALAIQLPLFKSGGQK